MCGPGERAFRRRRCGGAGQAGSGPGHLRGERPDLPLLFDLRRTGHRGSGNHGPAITEPELPRVTATPTSTLSPRQPGLKPRPTREIQGPWKDKTGPFVECRYLRRLNASAWQRRTAWLGAARAPAET